MNNLDDLKEYFRTTSSAIEGTRKDTGALEDDNSIWAVWVNSIQTIRDTRNKYAKFDNFNAMQEMEKFDGFIAPERSEKTIWGKSKPNKATAKDLTKELKRAGCLYRLPPIMAWMWTVNPRAAGDFFGNVETYLKNSCEKGERANAHLFSRRYFSTIEALLQENYREFISELSEISSHSGKGFSLPISFKRQVEDVRKFDGVTNHLICYDQDLYVQHAVHDEVSSLLYRHQEERSAAIYLSAEPGNGKTAIMAAIAREFDLRPEFSTIRYFFRSSAQNTLHNRIETCAKYICLRIGERYEIEYHLFLSTDSNNDDGFWRSLLGVLLRTISQQQKVTAQNPLLIIIDALDESDAGDLQRLDNKLNPFDFVFPMPDGVFIIQSSRYDASEFVSNCEEYQKVKSFSIYSDQFREHHINAVRRYAHNVCEKNESIKPYHAANSHGHQEDVRAEFVNTICEQAGYNFMVLRCALHANYDWHPVDGKFKMLSPELQHFYKKHIHNMARRLSQTMDENDVYCKTKIALCGAKPSWSEYMFAFALGEYTYGDKTPSILKDVLENWKQQGLLIIFEEDGHRKISGYHRSFFEFLEQKYITIDDFEGHASFLKRSVFQESDFLLPSLEGKTSVEKAEFLLLILKVAVHAQLLDIIIKILGDTKYIELTRDTTKISEVLKLVRSIPEGRETRERLSATMREVAKLLLTHAQNGLLYEGGVQIREPVALYQSAAMVSPNIADPDSVDLKDTLKNLVIDGEF